MYESHPLSEKACRPARASRLAPGRKRMLSGSFLSPFRTYFACWCRQTCRDPFGWKKSQLHLLHLLNCCPLLPLIFEQSLLSSNVNTEKRVEGPFGACLIGVPMQCKWRWSLTTWGPRGKMEARLRRGTWSLHGRWQPQRRKACQSGVEAVGPHPAEVRGRGN